MQSTIATLLLITAAVTLACVVVNYAVSVVESSTNPDFANGLLAKLNENSTLNQFDSYFNQTVSEPSDQLNP